MKLSIIIPYFNTKPFTDELLAVLDKQITDGVEVILIDDGSIEEYCPEFEWIKVIRTNNQGQSKARNLGLNIAVGDYIQFIDSDDMVSDNFIEKILEKIEEGKDLIEFSWKSLNSGKFNFHITEGDRLHVPSVVTRTFKRSYIGDARFNEKKDATEDEDFSRQLGYLYKPVDVSVISDYLYFYRDEVVGSNVKNYKAGRCHTKRITYFIPHVTDKAILEEIKKDDEENEVILLTYQNDIPELQRYCQVITPCPIWTHYQKGENYPLEVIPVPIKAKAILFINQLSIIGGIESFIYHLARLFKGEDMILVVNSIPEPQKKRLEEHIKVIQYSTSREYDCDTLVMLRILDHVPRNITYKQSVQMCHACRTNPMWHIPQNHDHIVNVSQASRDSFGDEAGMVIHNPIFTDNEKALILVSATRIPAPDKGDNEKRMRRLAEMLNEAEIPFVWFNFSEGQIPNPPKGMVNMGLEMDIRPYIASATYLVQLSDSEAWSYSILEALTQNVPVIVTEFPSAEEMGIIDGQNGYIVPFDMNFDVTKLKKVPTFRYFYDNGVIEKEWKKIFNHKIKTKKKKMVDVRIIQRYRDLAIGRELSVGEVVPMPLGRARQIIELGYGK